MAVILFLAIRFHKNRKGVSASDYPIDKITTYLNIFILRVIPIVICYRSYRWAECYLTPPPTVEISKVR